MMEANTMELTFLRSLFTVLVFVTFIGIWIWAWSSKRKQAFDEAARLPFVEPELPVQEKELRHE
jgi:cytochrome c oxidase cbb3-type subunit 4